MGKRKQTRGKCAFCGREMTAGGMSRHLRACPERKKAVEAANQGKGKEQTFYHLLARDKWNRDFWLHLEMRGNAPLDDLDYYLRAIWLECCGHLSMFSIGGWRGQEIDMGTPVNQVFRPGLVLTHIYDFGTSSETLIEVIETRRGKPLTSHPILLMARNNMPQETCTECDRPATHLCIECIYEWNQPGWLCDEHAEDHPHYTYGSPIPLINSPRLGMCGYEGPAEPPY